MILLGATRTPRTRFLINCVKSFQTESIKNRIKSRVQSCSDESKKRQSDSKSFVWTFDDERIASDRNEKEIGSERNPAEHNADDYIEKFLGCFFTSQPYTLRWLPFELFVNLVEINFESKSWIHFKHISTEITYRFSNSFENHAVKNKNREDYCDVNDSQNKLIVTSISN